MQRLQNLQLDWISHHQDTSLGVPTMAVCFYHLDDETPSQSWVSFGIIRWNPGNVIFIEVLSSFFHYLKQVWKSWVNLLLLPEKTVSVLENCYFFGKQRTFVDCSPKILERQDQWEGDLLNEFMQTYAKDAYWVGHLGGLSWQVVSDLFFFHTAKRVVPTSSLSSCKWEVETKCFNGWMW